jgi:hypothetical protein
MSRFRSVMCVALLSLLLEPAAALARQQRPARDPGDRVVCRGQRSTGSRIASHRTCRTAAQWEAEETHARDVSVRAIENRETRAPETNSDAPLTVGGPATTSPFVPPRN